MMRQFKREVIALGPCPAILDVAGKALLTGIEVNGGHPLPRLEQSHGNVERGRGLARPCRAGHQHQPVWAGHQRCRRWRQAQLLWCWDLRGDQPQCQRGSIQLEVCVDTEPSGAAPGEGEVELALVFVGLTIGPVDDPLEDRRHELDRRSGRRWKHEHIGRRIYLKCRQDRKSVV